MFQLFYHQELSFLNGSYVQTLMGFVYLVVLFPLPLLHFIFLIFIYRTPFIPFADCSYEVLLHPF